VRSVRLAWPGLALVITFVDDFVAGPLLVATGAWVGGRGGLLLGAAVFTLLVAVLVSTAVPTSTDLAPGVRARIDAAVTSASQRRFVGRYVHRVGDDHPWSTALVAAVVSPVLAVLLARMVHPSQRLIRTGTIAVLAYGLAFSFFYTGLGTGAAAAI
jgi:hypothetical protein